MVSRRNFAAITSMMLVVCFLFLLPQYWKAAENPYSQNIYVSEEPLPTASDRFRQPELTTQAALNSQQSYFAFLGDASGSTGYAVTTWAEYTKTPLAVFGHAADLAAMDAQLPRAVIVEGAQLELSGDLKPLLEWNQAGVTLIFAGLPEPQQLQKYPQFKQLLGIRWVTKQSVSLESIHLFPGFLLGGERIYGQQTPEDVELMNLTMEAPWYRLTSGTEVYLLGQVSLEELPEQPYRNERLPALLWRRSLNETNVFVVNGDYLTGNTGVGILSAIVAEDSPYYLYPVVNAQVVTVANFPGMADENNDALLPHYGRGSAAITRDLLWPSLESMAEINALRMSCFEMPQYDYFDGTEPNPELISYYLRLMRERGAEAGISLQHSAAISLEDKWNRDAAYLSLDAREYRYNAAFLMEEDLENWSGEVARSFSALSVRLTQREGLFFFLDEDTLCQTVTQDLLDYSFQADLELRSVQTALGYSNPMLNLLPMLWPEEGDEGWETAYEESASNLHTYWQAFSDFDRVTISESDRRIRAFLAMNYSQSREGDTVRLTLDGTDSADFILRTHKEVVSGITGGTAQELETGAWLIRAQQPQVEITLAYDGKYEY